MKKDRWVLVYSPFDFDLANQLLDNFVKAQGRFGIKVDEPQWIELGKQMDRAPKGQGYIDAIKADIYPKDTIIAVVLTQQKDQKQYIKKYLDELGVPSQFILVPTLKRSLGKIGVFSNILKQINAKVRLDLYRLRLPQHMANTMIVGVDVVNEGRQTLLGYTSSYSQYLS